MHESACSHRQVQREFRSGLASPGLASPKLA